MFTVFSNGLFKAETQKRRAGANKAKVKSKKEKAAISPGMGA
jgi:hypothetical protein